MPEQVIRTEGLSRSFRKKFAVQDVSLDVAAGSVYAFLGPNGAGKSTTIRMLLGLLRADGGKVALFGLPFDRNREAILARTGSLVEAPSVYPHLTARENLEIPRRILGAPPADIDRVLGIVGLHNAGRKLVRTFSLGMKQRLGLAQAMLGKRELLILDEPTNGLDPAGITEMRTLIRELPPLHGITVFLSSHLLGEVEQVATDVGILSQGKMVFQGSVASLAARRKARLRIRVSDSVAAGAFLRSRGWPSQAIDGSLVTDAVGAAAVINRALVEAGHDVHHLAVESATLEDLFLGMTEAEVL
jgi:ABC-type multidrug transport system ATPase subunit